MDVDDEERKVAIEAIATLVHIKHTMVELLLKPAGVPSDVYQHALYRTDETTGRQISKRKSAPLIVDDLGRRSGGDHAIRRIVEIAAEWSSFYLADNEFAARATVQKAQAVLGTRDLMQAREAEQRERARKEELAR